MARNPGCVLSVISDREIWGLKKTLKGFKRAFEEVDFKDLYHP